MPSSALQAKALFIFAVNAAFSGQRLELQTLAEAYFRRHVPALAQSAEIAPVLSVIVKRPAFG